MASKDAQPFVMSFVATSDKYRQQFIDKWQEVLANFIVDGAQAYNTGGGYRTPYSRDKVYRGTSKGRVLLKDPETHKLVMTYASKLVRSLFGDRDGKYLQAAPVGVEDANKAETVTKLLRYGFGLPGHFRTVVETLVDMLLFGTAVVELGWKYEEREMVVRSIEYGYGVETSTTAQMRVPVYDDPWLRPIDILDFYPDPSRYRLQEMSGAAKRFRMNAFEARRMETSGIYANVEEAISHGRFGSNDPPNVDFRAGLDQPAQKEQTPEFKEMIGYEYYGLVPWEEDGSSRRVITIINNVVVRDEPYPYADAALPFHSFIINPVQGRFYGISPAEIIRYDQSFADAMKMLLAEAVIRQVHPPIAVDSNADYDSAALKSWKADTIVSVEGGPKSIGTLRYAADIGAGFAMMQGLKASIQEGSGAMGGIQGEEGPDREAASVGVQRIQMALDRPELAAMVIESECLPPIGRAMLARFQQFVLDTPDLKKRVGELPAPVWLGDIMGDYDIRFIGSRLGATKQQKLQSFDRLMSYAQAVPAFQAYLPNMEMAQTLIAEWLELPEIAAMVGDPQQVMINLLMTQLMGGGGGMGAGGAAKNGVASQPEPAGLLPQQALGGTSGVA